MLQGFFHDVVKYMQSDSTDQTKTNSRVTVQDLDLLDNYMNLRTEGHTDASALEHIREHYPVDDCPQSRLIRTVEILLARGIGGKGVRFPSEQEDILKDMLTEWLDGKNKYNNVSEDAETATVEDDKDVDLKSSPFVEQASQTIGGLWQGIGSYLQRPTNGSLESTARTDDAEHVTSKMNRPLMCPEIAGIARREADTNSSDTSTTEAKNAKEVEGVIVTEERIREAEQTLAFVEDFAAQHRRTWRRAKRNRKNPTKFVTDPGPCPFAIWLDEASSCFGEEGHITPDEAARMLGPEMADLLMSIQVDVSLKKEEKPFDQLLLEQQQQLQDNDTVSVSSSFGRLGALWSNSSWSNSSSSSEGWLGLDKALDRVGGYLSASALDRALDRAGGYLETGYSLANETYDALASSLSNGTNANEEWEPASPREGIRKGSKEGRPGAGPQKSLRCLKMPISRGTRKLDAVKFNSEPALQLDHDDDDD